MNTTESALGLAMLLSLSASCAQVKPKPDFDRTRRLVEESTGRADVFDPMAPAITQEEVDGLLADGLSLEEAERLALSNNRELQALFQEVGIAHADWVQSKLYSNPSLDFLLAFPSGGGRGLLEVGLGVDLLELWQIPVRSDVARGQLESTVLRIAGRAGEFLAAARTAYYAALAADELQRVAQENLALTQRSFEAVRDLHAAGAADALDENMARGPLLTAQLMLEEARINASNAKRDLAKHLSLPRPVDSLQLTGTLPLECASVEGSEALVEEALGSRLDLLALQAEIELLQNRVLLEERRAWGEASAGPKLERPAESGAKLGGAGINLSLPLFDQNQAQVARARFVLEQRVKLYEAAQIRVAQDVRAGIERVNAASRALEFYREALLPQSQVSLDLAGQSYGAARTSLLALIEVQRQVLEARRAHVTLQLEAVAARSQLERLVGAPLE